MAADKRNILFLIDEFTTGGAQVVLFNIIDNLNKSRYQPFVFALFRDGVIGDELRERDIPASCLEIASPFNIGTFRAKLAELVAFGRHNEISLVHSLHTTSGIYGGIVAKKLKARSILNVHAPLSKSSASYLEFAARGLNSVLIPGNGLTENELRRSRVTRKKRIELIYNGINPSPRGRRTTTDEINISMVANFFPEKDHLTLVKAFEILQTRYPLKLRLIAAGENRYKERVMDYISQRGIAGVEIAEEKGDDLYSDQTDIFVLTSHAEGLPISVTEAMSAGLPVVASAVGAMDEIIDHGENGILVPQGDVDSLVKALEGLITDVEFRSRLSTNALEKYRQRFTIEKMARNYDALYETC